MVVGGRTSSVDEEVEFWLPNKSARGTKGTTRKPHLVVASLSVAVALQQPMRAKTWRMKITTRET